MASLSFLTKILQNVKPEAEWLADESYQILPRESVEAYTTQKVTVNGEEKDMLFVRSKTNTTTGKRLFKELPYNDEYLMYMVQDNINTAVQDVRDELTTLGGTVSTLNVDVGLLKTDVNNAKSDIETLTTNVETQGTTLEELKTKVESGPDLSGITDTINNLRSDVDTTIDEVSTLSGNVSTLQTDLAGKMDKAGGTFTGAVQLPAISGTPTDTQAITAKYMKDYINANPAGTQVVLSTSQPSGLPQGSIWLKQV